MPEVAVGGPGAPLVPCLHFRHTPGRPLFPCQPLEFSAGGTAALEGLHLLHPLHVRRRQQPSSPSVESFVRTIMIEVQPDGQRRQRTGDLGDLLKAGDGVEGNGEEPAGAAIHGDVLNRTHRGLLHQLVAEVCQRQAERGQRRCRRPSRPGRSRQPPAYASAVSRTRPTMARRPLPRVGLKWLRSSSSANSASMSKARTSAGVRPS